MGAAAAEYEDQTRNSGPLLYFPPTLSPCRQSWGDPPKSHHGGAQKLAYWAEYVWRILFLTFLKWELKKKVLFHSETLYLSIAVSRNLVTGATEAILIYISSRLCIWHPILGWSSSSFYVNVMFLPLLRPKNLSKYECILYSLSALM